MRFLALVCCAAVGAAATATGFDGRSLDGPLAVGADGHLRIGATAISLADVDVLVLGTGPVPRCDGNLGVLLVDGSWLPATAIANSKAPDSIAAEGPLGRIELPLTAIGGWGDPAPPPAGDDDAVLVASGLLRGRVQGLKDGVLAFTAAADPEPLALQLAQLKGLRLAQPPAKTPGVRLRAVLDPARPPLDLVLSGATPALAAAAKIAIDPALFGSLPLRVEGGRRVYLGDLPPANVQEDGAFGVVWPHAVDGAIGGGPLLLAGRRFAKGLVVHSAAVLAWKLDNGYLRLRAQVGIADTVAPQGDCIAVILADGRERWRSRVRGTDPPRDLDLDIAGAKTLTLRVELGEHQDIGDHLALADAQLIRK